MSERSGLRPKTRLYEGLVRLHIVPTLGRFDLVDVTPARVRTWRASLLAGGLGEPTVAKAYRLLRPIMRTAVEDRLIRANPCQIKGAAVERSPERPTLTVDQVYAVADGMPKRWRCLPLLGTFCSLRWGELAALVRHDVVIEAGDGTPVEGWVNVRTALVELVDGSIVIGAPKTAAGRRVLAIPAAILPDVHDHLTRFTGPTQTSPVFTGPQGRTPASEQLPVSLASRTERGGCRRRALPRPAPHGQHLDRAGWRDAARRHGPHGSRKRSGRTDLPPHELDAGPGRRGLAGRPGAARTGTQRARPCRTEWAGRVTNSENRALTVRFRGGAGDENRTRTVSLGS